MLPPPRAVDDEDPRAIRASYGRVLLVWVLTLAALFAFQFYFAAR